MVLKKLSSTFKPAFPAIHQVRPLTLSWPLKRVNWPGNGLKRTRMNSDSVAW